MRDPKNDSLVQTLRLTQRKAFRFAELLSRMLDQLQDRPGVDGLRDFLERLDEAHWISQWLREYVRLDVSPGEVADLVQVVTAMLEEDWSDEDLQLVSELLAELQPGPASPAGARQPMPVSLRGRAAEPSRSG